MLTLFSVNESPKWAALYRGGAGLPISGRAPIHVCCWSSTTKYRKTVYS